MNTTPPASDAVPLLRVEGVRHCFGGLTALDGVTFSVGRGQIKAVIGPNGAGKTTLFNIISGILKPTAGSIAFCGRPTTGLPPFRIAQLGVSRTFQNVSLFTRMTVLENVMIARHSRTRCGMLASALRLPAHQREERAIRAAAMEPLEFAGLADLAHVPVGALSFGRRRMVELARALATEPALLLLDEPASGLDPRARIEMMAILQELQRLGKTIIISSHILSELQTLCNRVAIIEKGRLIYSGPVQGVRDQVSQARVMWVRVSSDQAQAIELLKARKEIADVTTTDGEIKVTLAGPDIEHSVVADILVRGGAKLIELREDEIGLEEVFMRVTRGETQ